MKTYENHPSSSLLTTSAIAETGETHLYSALNFGRVIAFTGSGSTMEYGRPSWSDLVDTFIRLAEANKKAVLGIDGTAKQEKNDTLGKVVNKERLQKIWKEFVKLFGPQKGNNIALEYRKIPTALRQNADFTVSFLTMCEQIASWSVTNDDREKKSKRLTFRKNVADEFAKTNIVSFYDAIVNSIDHDQANTFCNIEPSEKSTFLEDNFEHHFLRDQNGVSGTVRINSKATIAILCFLLAKALNQNNQGSQACLTSSDLPSKQIYKALIKYLPLTSLSNDPKTIDPLTEIYQGLGIRRFLTLNYDIEIERMLATHLANCEDESHKAFCEFLKTPVSDKEPTQEMELRNGLQQAIRTSSIGEDNLGDLFTFGAFSTSFQASIFHLHGRVDDPENMIITQLDYERLYLQSSNQRRSFEEARHAVFNGGDILFVGSGMKETDIMAPLRYFTARHRKLDDAPGRVYALILSSIHPDNWEAENTGQAQALFKHYGVYTFFLDGSDSKEHIAFRTARMWFSALSTKLNSDKLSLPELKKFRIDDLTLRGSPLKRPKSEINSLQTIPEALLVGQAIQEICIYLEKRTNTIANIRKDLVIAILERLVIESEKRLKSSILQNKLADLAKAKTKWWEKWEKRPKHRLAIYGELEKPEDKPLIWIRHRADYHYDKAMLAALLCSTEDDKPLQSGDTDSPESVALYQSYFKQLKEEADKTKHNASRIVRFTAPKGAGKGSLIKLLSEKIPNNNHGIEHYPFELIFPKEETNYVGGFFAHLTFTLEFTSTIFALIRFVAKAAKIEQDPYLSADAISGFQQGRHTGIWLLKHALREMAKRECRIFICLSGLFRLVDDDGDAYSPVHREFFRVITQTDLLISEGKKPKIDLLLFARTQAQPIRYLSNESPALKRDQASKNTKKYSLRRNMKIERWPIFEPFTPKHTFKMAFQAARSEFLKAGFDTQALAIQTIDGLIPDQQESLSNINSLHTFTNQNTVHIFLLVSLVCWKDLVQPEDDKTKQNNLSLLVNRLNIAVGRSGTSGFTKQIIKEYRLLDLKALNKKSYAEKVAPVNITDVTLRHLALFNHPIQSSVLLECPDLSMRLEQQLKALNQGKGEGIKQTKALKLKLLNTTLDQLVAKRLVIRILPRSGNYDSHCRYSLHREVAKVVTLDMNYITQYTLSSAPYQTTFYCAQAQARRGVPSADHFSFVTRLLKHLVSIIHYSLEHTDIDKKNNKPKLNFYECSKLLRGAYAILRGSFSIGAISRLEIMHELNNKQPYEAYRLWIQNLIHLSIRLSKYQDDLVGTKKMGEAEAVRLRHNLPFYRDEVAWLYNEQAVVSFMQGKLYDAAILYHQALNVVKSKPEYDENQSVGAPRRRIEINLAIAEIERGNIHKAIELLDSAINKIVLDKSSTPSMTSLYAQGYRALCDHLTGNLTKAEKGYMKVIKQVQKKRQLRATSIFQRHLADLYRIKGEAKKATKLLLLSEKAASQAQQEDILHYTLISKARLMRDLKSRAEALQILRRTEDYAKTMGLRKMLAEALKVRAEVMLAEGEVTQAGKMSAQAVAIFNRNGLRLRKISAALLQAKVYKKRGQIKFAEKILAEIEREASSLGYTLKSSAAQENRQNLMS